MKLQDVENKVRDLAEPLLTDMGLELVDVEYKNEHGSWVLRVYIDKPGGVTLDDCTDVSRELGTLLDVEDPVPQSYNLEVSSPGLNRPLVKEKDFKKFSGHRAKIRTTEPIEGRKNFKVTIKGFEDGSVVVEDDQGTVYSIGLGNIEKARLIAEV